MEDGIDLVTQNLKIVKLGIAKAGILNRMVIVQSEWFLVITGQLITCN